MYIVKNLNTSFQYFFDELESAKEFLVKLYMLDDGATYVIESRT